MYKQKTSWTVIQEIIKNHKLLEKLEVGRDNLLRHVMMSKMQKNSDNWKRWKSASRRQGD